MKRIALAAALTTATATTALAGGIDRSGQFLQPLFEDGGDSGGFVQFSFGSVSPQVSASSVVGDATDPLSTYEAWGMAAKFQLSDQLSFALIGDQPFGANVNYYDGPFRPAALVAAGIVPSANISSQAWTGLLRYEFSDNWSAHGGLRAQTVKGNVNTNLNLPGGGITYRLLDATSEVNYGFVGGVAYERPDIALRVALTYNSEVEQDLTGTEVVLGAGPGGSPSVAPTAFTITTPASLNLEFQTGIAADTLLFGSVRYVEWEGFNLTTPGTGRYVDFDEDTTTYALGIGRRFNETWSAALTLGFEPKGAFITDTGLAPTTGSKSIGLAANYTQGNTTVTMGVTYAQVGNRQFDLGGVPLDFTDGEVVGVGVRVGLRF